jgi:hypothetical protein
MANDSALFVSSSTLKNQGLELAGNCFCGGETYFLPLYEAKMVWHFDHRWSKFSGDESQDFGIHEKMDSCRSALPRYWLAKKEVDCRFADWRQGWQLGYRRVTCSTNERTAVVSVFPYAGVGHTITLIRDISARHASMFTANASSFVFDYTCRQKVSGADLTITVFEQLPILPSECYVPPWPEFILSRVLELIYTAWDLEPFARDCGWSGPPFRWDEARRFLLRCELDAAFFNLYGINRDDADYILETFPIVKRKDVDAHGTYRTKDTILRIYDALSEAQRTGTPYQTVLAPAPAHIRVAHPFDWTQKPFTIPEEPRVAIRPVENYAPAVLLELVVQCNGKLSWDRLRKAWRLLSDPDGLAKRAELQFGFEARKWKQVFNDRLALNDLVDTLSGFCHAGTLWFGERDGIRVVEMLNQEEYVYLPHLRCDARLALAVGEDLSPEPELSATHISALEAASRG